METGDVVLVNQSVEIKVTSMDLGGRWERLAKNET